MSERDHASMIPKIAKRQESSCQNPFERHDKTPGPSVSASGRHKTLDVFSHPKNANHVELNKKKPRLHFQNLTQESLHQE
jgi:hypothetical protein